MEIWFYDEFLDTCYLSAHTEKTIQGSGNLERFIYFFVEAR